MANVLGCGLAVSKFELQSRYYDHFRINTHGKGVEPSYPPSSFSLNSIPTTAILQGWFCHQNDSRRLICPKTKTKKKNEYFYKPKISRFYYSCNTIQLERIVLGIVYNQFLRYFIGLKTPLSTLCVCLCVCVLNYAYIQISERQVTTPIHSTTIPTIKKYFKTTESLETKTKKN